MNLYLGSLHKLRADVMRPDYPWVSKLPHLQVHVGASNLFNFSVYVEAIDLFGSLDLYVIRYGDTCTAVQSSC